MEGATDTRCSGFTGPPEPFSFLSKTWIGYEWRRGHVLYQRTACQGALAVPRLSILWNALRTEKKECK